MVLLLVGDYHLAIYSVGSLLSYLHTYFHFMYFKEGTESLLGEALVGWFSMYFNLST